MCTLIGHSSADPVSLHDHPIARVLAAVRERCKARKLNFILTDECLDAARKHLNAGNSEASAAAIGQRKADKLAGAHRVHDWRGNNSPEAA